MTATLPGGFQRSGSLAAVLASSLAAVAPAADDGDIVVDSLRLGHPEWVVVALIDGLGFDVLRARSGHARFLADGLTRRQAITSGFPTTTATALTSFSTGVLPGVHGMTGYRAIDPAADRVVNLLHGWDDTMGADEPHAASWQRSMTLFERAKGCGVTPIAVGPPSFTTSPFTRAVLRGADYRPGARIGDRVDVTLAALRQPGPGIVYLYVNELDRIAHAQGWESTAFTHALETVDANLRRLSRGLSARHGLLVTADHGMLDIPSSSHVLFEQEPHLTEGVRHVAGDPRVLQLGLEDPGRADDLAARWRDIEGHRADIVTRQEAIDAGWFGPVVDDVVRARIGDVLVAARGRVAYYDGRSEPAARAMVGQHGSFDPAELRVPLLRYGAITG